MKKRHLLRMLCLALLLLMYALTAAACGDNSGDKPGNNSGNNTGQQSGSEDEEAVAEDQPIVYFSSPSGFYSNPLDLELRCPVEGATIYYTTDGTIPNENSIRYDAPLTLVNCSSEPNRLSARTDYAIDTQYVPSEPVNKANIIRAIAYFEDGTSSIVTNATYFIGIDRERLYGDAPVISLITDPLNLVDDEYGIFIMGKTYRDWLAEDPANASEEAYRIHGNFSNKGRDWERPVAFEYIPAEGKGISADMGLRMKGASTRTYLQKSMRLIAREEYGTKNIKYDLIPGNTKSDKSGELTKYKSFVLRNGGNDNSFGKLRDPLIQSLVADRAFETQQSTPCVVYLDGEYWGLYALTEDYSDNYIENNYGVDSNNVVIVKCAEIDEGTDEDFALYEELYNFIVNEDMSVAANYAKAQEMLDIPGLIDYCATALYIYNHDSLFEDNNWSMWRVREADDATPWSDGKWRMLLYDTEFSSGVYTNGKEFSEDNFSKVIREAEKEDFERSDDLQLRDLFYSLYKNEEFRKDFILTLFDLRNFNFDKTRVGSALDEMSVAYRKLAPDTFYRYGPDWVVMWNDPKDYYDEKLKEVRVFFNGRHMAFPNMMQSVFKLSAPQNVTIEVNDSEMGDIILNNTYIDLATIPGQSFVGSYSPDYDLTLTAVPLEGYRFVRWNVTDAEISDETSTTATLSFSGKCTVIAEYEAE